MAYAWTEDRVAKLRELHAKKFSASQIAAELPRARGEEPPTRNAVIGKLTRLNMVFDGSKKERYRPRVSTPAAKIEAPNSTVPKPRPAPSMPTGAPRGSEAILGLRNGLCCFPIGDPHADDFRYCCTPSGVKTYCAHHMAVAYVPSKPREKKRDNWHAKGKTVNGGKAVAIFDRAAYSKPLLDATYSGDRNPMAYAFARG